MNLTPHEQERLLVSLAAMVARDRRERGLKLNHPEAVAILSSFVLEGARDGRSVAELMDAQAGADPATILQNLLMIAGPAQRVDDFIVENC